MAISERGNVSANQQLDTNQPRVMPSLRIKGVKRVKTVEVVSASGKVVTIPRYRYDQNPRRYKLARKDIQDDNSGQDVEIPEGDPVIDWRKDQLIAFAEREGIEVDINQNKGKILEAIQMELDDEGEEEDEDPEE